VKQYNYVPYSRLNASNGKWVVAMDESWWQLLLVHSPFPSCVHGQENSVMATVRQTSGG